MFRSWHFHRFLLPAAAAAVTVTTATAASAAAAFSSLLYKSSHGACYFDVLVCVLRGSVKNVAEGGGMAWKAVSGFEILKKKMKNTLQL